MIVDIQGGAIIDIQECVIVDIQGGIIVDNQGGIIFDIQGGLIVDIQEGVFVEMQRGVIVDILHIRVGHKKYTTLNLNTFLKRPPFLAPTRSSRSGSVRSFVRPFVPHFLKW